VIEVGAKGEGEPPGEPASLRAMVRRELHPPGICPVSPYHGTTFNHIRPIRPGIPSAARACPWCIKRNPGDQFRLNIFPPCPQQRHNTGHDTGDAGRFLFHHQRRLLDLYQPQTYFSAMSKYRVTLIEHEDGVSVSCPALKGCHSQGRTREEALQNIREAIQEWLAAEAEESKIFKVSEAEVMV
jgi:predicted RNase H-like HicB family nuclease